MKNTGLADPREVASDRCRGAYRLGAPCTRVCGCAHGHALQDRHRLRHSLRAGLRLFALAPC
eukprot:710108-Rhodomonas_salina.1